MVLLALLSGILMLVSSYIVVMRLQDAALGHTGTKVGGSNTRIKRRKSHSDCADGHCIVCITQRRQRRHAAILGSVLQTMWLVLEMVGHLSQTAPLRTLGELHADHPTHAMAIYQVSEEFAEALLMTGTFFAALTALCYGLSLISGGNRLAGYVFLNRRSRVSNWEVDSPTRHSTPCCSCVRLLS